ncbi:MAG: hypothetical protein LBV54_00600 [Puniceicoccales bacterium]|jgi:hypothetical protein|nr:hypothetical protein [Puniceicoccales bacterium]
MFTRFISTFALVVAAGMTTHAADDGLIGRWTLDNASGDNAADARFPATLDKDVKSVTGILGNALEFPGKGVVAITPDVLPKNIQHLTFSAWIAPTRLSTVVHRKVKRRLPPQPFNDDCTIVRKEDGESRLVFALQDDNVLALGLSCGRNYVECRGLVLKKEITDGNWHFVAGTFDGKTMRVWLDGREIGSQERQSPLTTVYDFVNVESPGAGRDWAPADGSTPGAPLHIGSMDGKQNFFSGKIDDVRFYSKALNAAQLGALYAEGKQQPSDNAKTARETAKKLYKKTASFETTLAAIASNAKADAKPDAFAAIELQRLLRADFPVETNDYVAKWKKNPVDLALLSQSELNKRASYLSVYVPANAFEYLPLTPLQWSVLNKEDRAYWERAKAIKADLEAGKPLSVESVLFVEGLVNERPSQAERIAWGGDGAKTPKTKNRSAVEARRLIESEWLYQVNGKPTIQHATNEVGYTRRILERIGFSKSDTADYQSKLTALENKIKDRNGSPKDLYFAVRELKREIMFKNPVVDFDTVLYTDSPNPSGSEWTHETRHRLGYMSLSKGGRLLVQKGLQPDGKLTLLSPQEPLGGTFWRPDLSFDASKVLFSFKPHNEKTFHIYEIGIDGSGLRQLTGGMFDDLDPIYLPDGKNIMFTTTRGHIYVRCMPTTNAFVTARMALDTKPGDKSLYIISRNGEPEYTPSVMHDGRVIYTRWEYTDKPLWRAQSLWTMNQNGTLAQTFWGNQSVWPDLLKDARQIPNSKRIIFTGAGHHNWFEGSIGIIDPSKGLNFPDGLTKVTQEISWPETNNGPVDPKESANYHNAPYSSYDAPYPLSEKDFLVSARKGRNGDKFVLLLMDTDGNREIINEGEHNIRYAIPVRKRPVPAVQPDLVKWPTWETRDNPSTGQIYSNNVYENAPEVLKDKAKYLRIWSIEHKTYTFWAKRPYASSGPEISAVQSEGIKKIIGTVPIEDDGSVNFNAPSGIALHFQLLDKDQRALQTMKSFTGVQPGEVRACVGCHEQHMNTPAATAVGKAFRRAPADITPVPWQDITVGYERYVQPALDKYCGSCHADESKVAFKTFNSKLRPGFLGFKEPYMTLLGNPSWGSAYKLPKNKLPGGFGWADTIMVEGFNTDDPAAYSTYPAMTKLSYKSRLVERMSSGKHYGVKVDPVNLLRVIHWVDAMGPFFGGEELRQMEDPAFYGKDWLSQRPRIKTAPIVQRPGPFDPFDTAGDAAYAEPNPNGFNKLPVGVKRKEAAVTVK